MIVSVYPFSNKKYLANYQNNLITQFMSNGQGEHDMLFVLCFVKAMISIQENYIKYIS